MSCIAPDLGLIRGDVVWQQQSVGGILVNHSVREADFPGGVATRRYETREDLN